MTGRFDCRTSALNLIVQILDFGVIGARSLVPFGHCWSLTTSSGMTNTSTNHYHSSRLIGRIHRRVHTFFSNARRPTEGTRTSAKPLPPAFLRWRTKPPQSGKGRASLGPTAKVRSWKFRVGPSQSTQGLAASRGPGFHVRASKDSWLLWISY